MTFQFPNSPTLGQTFAPADGPIYVWDGAAWRAIGSGAPSTVRVGDTPPPSPVPGQMWWDSNSAKLYIFYQDIDSAAWVHIFSGPTGPIGPAGEGIYDTTTAMPTIPVPSGVNAIRTNGYATPGDGGGALYIRVVSAPAHAGKVQSMDGAWWELASTTVNPFMFGAKGDDITDDVIALQTCFDYATGVKQVEVHCVGHFKIGAKLTIGGAVASLSRTFHFDCWLTTTYTSNAEAVRIQNLSHAVCDGDLNVFSGGSLYADRRQLDVVIIEACSRSAFPHILAWGAKRNGITVLPNSNASKFPMLHPSDCGGALTGTLTAWSNTGSANSGSQRTVLTVTDIPATLEATDFVIFGGRPYSVMAVNLGLGTIDVFPWVISPAAGPVTYIIGAGVLFNGNDSNICQIGLVDSTGNGVGYKIRALYPATLDQLHSSGDGIACSLGTASSSAWIGGRINNFYVEGPTANINFVECADPNGASFSIGTFGPASLTQVFKPYQNAGSTHAYRNLRTSIQNFNGKPYHIAGYLGGTSVGSSGSPPLWPTSSSFLTKYGDTQTINLLWDVDCNRLFGLDTVHVLAIGSGTRGNPTGTWTFAPPAGWTIVGQTVFSGMSVPTLFTVHFAVPTSQAFVTQVTQDWQSVSADKGNAAATLTLSSADSTTVWATPLTVDRAVTLSTTGAVNGKRLRIVRKATATGAFNLNVGTGPLKALAVGQWCEVEYDGTAWALTAYGAL